MQPSLWILLGAAALTAGYEDIIVRTASGPVHGYVHVTRHGVNYYTFAGIPYASPPTGRLRFMPPEPVEPWTEVREALHHGPPCPQVNTYLRGTQTPAGKEDCLYLSVYSKKLDGKAPVLVHFHGGGWIFGDGPRTQGPEYLMDTDIVIVDFTSRLGILGYLSFEDSVLPGNLGLKDQVMALKWIKENIRHFGGDPDQVTLMGECTGADAVYHHMLSPMSAGLFHRVIAESGTSFSVRGVVPPGVARERALRLAGMVGCEGTTEQIVACLREEDATDLMLRVTSFIEWQVDPMVTFGPVFEQDSPDAFLIGPESNWKPPTIPLLTGTTSGEGLIRTMSFTHDFDLGSLTKEEFNHWMPVSLMIKYSSSNPEEVLQKIKNYYVPEDTISMKNFKNFTDMYGDGWFSFGVLEGAKFTQGDVYMYYFDYLGEMSKAQIYGDISKATGAFHTDESIYLWQDMRFPPLKGTGYKLSKDLVKLFTNFVIYGNPTPTDEFGFKWTPYKPDENYLAIRGSGYTMEKGLLTDRYNFWKSLNHMDKLV